MHVHPMVSLIHDLKTLLSFPFVGWLTMLQGPIFLLVLGLSEQRLNTADRTLRIPRIAFLHRSNYLWSRILLPIVVLPAIAIAEALSIRTHHLILRSVLIALGIAWDSMILYYLQQFIAFTTIKTKDASDEYAKETQRLGDQNRENTL